MDVLVQQEGFCATDVGAAPTADMNLKAYDQLSNNWVEGQFGASLAVFLCPMAHDGVAQVKSGV